MPLRNDQIVRALSRQLLRKAHTRIMMRYYTEKLPKIRYPDNAAEWTRRSAKIRKDLLSNVYLRGHRRGILNVPIAWTIPQNLTITRRHTGWNTLDYETYVTDGVADVLTSYRLQAENFVAAARGQARPVIPLAQSVVNTFAVEALATSVLEKRVVDIAVPGRIAQAYAAAVRRN